MKDKQMGTEGIKSLSAGEVYEITDKDKKYHVLVGNGVGTKYEQDYSLTVMESGYTFFQMASKSWVLRWLNAQELKLIDSPKWSVEQDKATGKYTA